MAFDLASARPVDEPQTSPSGFDLASARPVDQPSAPRGLDMPVRTGASAIPTAAETAGQSYVAPPPPAPRREPTVRDKVFGAVEAAVDVLAQVTGGTAGLAIGGLSGIGRTIGQGGLGTAAGAISAEQSAAAGAEAGANVVRGGLRWLTAGGVGGPMSEQGQEYTEQVGGLMNQLPAYTPAIGPAQGMAAGLSGAKAIAQDKVRGGLQGPMRAITETIDRVMPERAPTAGTKASAGASGTDVATQRRERAANLPVPIQLTKGQAERTFQQQRFERETAKAPEEGKPLRDRFADQNEAVLKNFESFVEQTGAEELDAGALGRKVNDAIVEKAVAAKEEIRAAYKAADDAGETAEVVPTDRIVAKLADIEPSATNAGVIKTAEAELVRLGGATRDADGRLVPGQISLKDMEELRKTVGVGGKKDATNSHFADEIRSAIDASTEGAGGDLYKGARKLYAAHAKEFKEQGVIRDLITLKKNSSDRRTAFEDVFARAMLKGSLADVENVKRTLTTAGARGEQAWKDLRGKTIDHLKEQTYGNTARDERGNPIASVAKLDAAMKSLDTDGKLEFLFGKEGAEQLRDINDAAKDIYTAPPGAVNTSNTATVLMQALDTMLTFSTTGAPVPALTALKAIRDKVKQRKTNKLVREALGPKQRLEPTDTTRKFEEKPAEAPTAPRETDPVANAPAAPAAAPDVPTHPRLAEIARLKEGASPETIRVLDDQAKKVERELRREQVLKKRAQEADSLEKAAAATEDPDIRAALIERANELRPEKIPVGEVKDLDTTPTLPVEKVRGKLPVGEARELPLDTGRGPDLPPLPVGRVIEGPPKIDKGGAAAKIPVGEAREIPITPETLRAVDDLAVNAADEAAWRKLHRFGDLDAKSSQQVARAIRYDAGAVDQVMQQHERSPRVFEREIARIIDEGNTRASQTEQTGGSGQSLDSDSGQARSGAGAERGQARPDSLAQARAKRDAADAAGRQRQEVGGEAAAKAATVLQARADVPPTVRQRLLERYKAAELVKPKFDDAMNAALAELGRDGRQVKLAVIKGAERAADKVMVDYSGDTDRIKDLVRGTLVIRDIEATTDAIQALERRFGKLIGLRNALEEGSEPVGVEGYRDIKANVVIDGHMAEVQVNVPEMLAAKKEAHPLYKRVEEIKRQTAKEDRDPTPAEATERADLERRQKAIYAAAWDLSLRRRSSLDTSARNAASEITVPLRSADDAGNRRGSAPAPSTSQARYANAGERVTGTSSTSKNTVPSGKESGSFIATTSNPILGENPIGRQTIATTERGVEIPVRYRLVDVGQLITSHDDSLRPNPKFPPSLQPRDRSRQSSEAQIARIENNINPELLAESHKASDGAPIIGADGLVESGNARTIALRRAYAAGKATKYRDWLIDNAGRFGLSEADARRFKKPVLVREGLGKYDRADFARQANESAVSAMSETEIARSDAQRMPDLDGLITGEDGSVNLARSADFVRDFMRTVVGPNERNALMTSDGRLSQRGAQRIRNAIFAKAYGDADIVAMLTESTDANVKNVLAGLLRAAPNVARLRDLIDAGARPRVEFVPDLIDAVRRYSALREGGMTVSQALGQGSLVGGEASPRVAELMRELEANARAPKRIAETVQRFVDEIDAQGDPRQAGIFADEQ